MSHDDCRVLAARSCAELKDIERVVSRAERAMLLLGQHPEQDIYVDAAAHNPHDFYSALERFFLQIAKVVDRSMPQEERWHRDLLDQMCLAVHGVRPAVLKEDAALRLEEYPCFRHVVRSVDSLRTDPKRVTALVDAMHPLVMEVAEQLKHFAEILEHWSSEAERR